MEFMKQGYLDVMAMPIGRRKRFCEEKEHFEQYLAAKRKNAENKLGRR